MTVNLYDIIVLSFYSQAVGLLFLTRVLAARLLHLALQPLDLNQVLRVERQTWVVAVRLVRAEASVGGLLAARLHRVRAPERLEVPVVFAQIPDRFEVLAGGDRALVVDDRAGGAGIARELRLLLGLRAVYEAVHVNVYGRLEEAGLAAVVVLDSGVARVLVNHTREARVARVVNV